MPRGRASRPRAKRQGKALSFNNVADTDAALECVKSFDAPACVIVKHANPCGVAVGERIRDAYDRAFKDRPARPRSAASSPFKPPARCGDRRGHRRAAVRRGHHRSPHRGGGTRGALAQGERPGAGVRRALHLASGRHSISSASPEGCWSRTATPAPVNRGRPGGRDAARAHGGGDARSPLRVEGGEVREVERHRLLPRRHDRSASGPAR